MAFVIRGAFVAAAAAALAVAACSKGDPMSSSSSGSGGGLTIVITASGASPRTLTVSPGSQITFVNNDTQPHEMYSDPHPEHTDCPEFDSVGRLKPGETRQTTNLVIVRTCGFHDHINPFVTSLTGSIKIQ